MLSEAWQDINKEKKENSKPIDTFRKRYVRCVRGQGVPQKRVRWYLSWIEQFARTSHLPMEKRTPEDVEQFLRDLLQRPKLQDWQHAQAIDALRILYLVLLKAPWATKWEWNLKTQGRIVSYLTVWRVPFAILLPK